MTIAIRLTKDYFAIVDDEDADLGVLKWQASFEGSKPYASRGYRIGSTFRVLRMHRVIMARVEGRQLERGERVYHKNDDMLDNRRANLELRAAQLRQHNPRPRSRFHGVDYMSARGKWRARIKTANGRKHIGLFESAEEAARAYDEKAIELYGAHARLNFPEAQS